MKKLSMILMSLAAAALVGCGGGMGGANTRPDVEIRTGTIEQITDTTVKSEHDKGLGAIIGGVAGAGLGSLIGAGTGRDVAIAAGAIAGVIGGNAAQNRFFDKPEAAQQIFVRLASGVIVVVTQPPNPALRRGMRVYVSGSGNDARVEPA